MPQLLTTTGWQEDPIALLWRPRATIASKVAAPVLLPSFCRLAGFQHACSLVAHTFCCCGPRLSHLVWMVDYCAIALNFAWNAPMVYVVAFIACEQGGGSGEPSKRV